MISEKRCKHPECTFAGVTQPIDQFSRDSSRKDGRHPYCRSCRTRLQSIRMQDPEARNRAREATRKYDTSDKGKATRRQYHAEHMDQFREKSRRFRQTEHGRQQRDIQRQRYHERNKAKDAARFAVAYAIRKGTLVVPDTCQWCNKPMSRVDAEAHHWRGYDPGCWLDVKFVHGRPCHLECEFVDESDWP